MPVLRSPRVRAPELEGRGWLNTGGKALTSADLRGRFVLLDFWTFCCVNCLHVLDELRPVERRYADVLVTIGVHSPKFPHEADAAALAAAVERYDVRHPVLDDPHLRTWDAYAAKAWPTLVLVDPEGYVAAHLSGEGHAHGLATLLDRLVAEHDAAGTLARAGSPYVPPPAPATRLRYPGGAVRLPGGDLLVADTARHQLVRLAPDAETERSRFGDGTRGLRDGPAATARFGEPQGVTLLPEELATRVGFDVLVADSVNHALRGVRLADRTVTTVAGTGEQLRTRVAPGEGGPALASALSTPWDVAWWPELGAAVIAMAGTHQLWAFHPGADPAAGRVEVLAGTTNEGLVDGDATTAWFAQPSGLAVAPGGALWVADSETSALREVRLTDPTAGAAEAGDPSSHPPGAAGIEVRTAIGRGLFEFGHRDGPGSQALLQHPLGVAVLPDGSIAVADTYNGAIRRYHPGTGEVTTLATDLAEPSAVLVAPGAQAPRDDGPSLLVVESAAHRLTAVAVPASAQRVDGGASRVVRPPTDLAPGPVTLEVAFTPPSGQHLDDRWGDPTWLDVAATPSGLLAAGAGASQGLVRRLVLAPTDGSDPPDGVLHVSVRAAACDADPSTGEVPPHAACHLYQQDWGIPVRLRPGAPATLVLHLRGTNGL